MMVYVFYMAIALVIIGFKPLQRIVDFNGIYTKFVVLVTAFVLQPFGIVKGVEGSIIHLRGISLNILFGCNGLEAFLIYAAAVLAFRGSFKKKIIGISTGFFVLQLLNVIRIVALGVVGVYFHQYFYYFHIYIAQGIMIAVSLILFLGYISYAGKG